MLFRPSTDHTTRLRLRFAGAKIFTIEDPMSTQDDALEREFDIVMTKAGISVPPQRRAGLLVSYKDMQRMAALLRQPRTAASEPSNVFSLKPFLRKA